MPEIDIRSARIFFQLEGDESAPALILSGSLGTTQEIWEAQMEAFSKHFRVLRYDHRGHGRSHTASGFSIEEMSLDVLALADALHIDDFSLCGISVGGMVGMWLGVHAPERLNRLVLANTAARIGTQRTWNDRIEKVNREGIEGVVAISLERWFTERFREREPDRVAHALGMLRSTSPDGYIAACAALRDADMHEEIVNITAPVLALAGRHDRATPPDQVRLIAERVCGAQFIDVDAAHLANVEAAPVFTGVALSFLLGA